jgi:hypothetical protein
VANWVGYDVSFATSQFVRFCSTAGVSHWAALHHVMGYLHSTPSFKLVYRRGNDNRLDGYTGSDWGNRESRQSTTGLLARYNKYIVLWRLRMQKTIALSTAEGKYYYASEIAAEIIYIRNLIRNMRLPQDDHTLVYEDNTACIEWGNHSSVVVSVRSISKSASTSYMKSFRIATCCLSGVKLEND